jgi:spermidine synthase
VRITIILILLLLSGGASLIYEILWMRQLGNLFGGTAQAVAVTTATFFAGLGAGSWWWGARSTHAANPLRLYAWLEFGIAALALGYFGIAELHALIEARMLDHVAQGSSALLAIRFSLAVLLVCPATFLMGGTLPLLGHIALPFLRGRGAAAGLIYGTNTLGAVLGAIAAGFILPRIIGLQNAYLIAMIVSVATGIGALLLSRAGAVLPVSTGPTKSKATRSGIGINASQLNVAAFASGGVTLALQVLWVHMFVQVWHHSSDTFAAILATFLLSLALGAYLVRILAARVPPVSQSLVVTLGLAGAACLATPFLFNHWAADFAALSAADTLPGYVVAVLIATFGIVGVPMIIAGMILPSLYRYANGFAATPGAVLGRLQAWNLGGAIVGSLLAGFVVLPVLGQWDGIRFVALCYFVVAMVLANDVATRGALLAILILLFFGSGANDRSSVRLGPGETLVEAWQSGAGSVAVVSRNNQLNLKIDNWYTLGGTGELAVETAQTHLPMQLHPRARRVFYLGLGTGISAGAVLSYPVTEVLISELSADVITASNKHFAAWTGGLFNDPRVRILHADGRTLLRGSNAKFDLVIGDLFVPWRRGIGSLYTLEHFESARDRLHTAGLFVQWLPLYQLTEREFTIIARTMTEAFAQVTLWRGGFSARLPMLALVGHSDETALDPQAGIVQRSAQDLRQLADDGDAAAPMLSYFVASLDAQMGLLRDAPISTENMPLVEYLAADSYRAQQVGQADWLTTAQLLKLLNQLQQQVPPESDPYLNQLDASMVRTVRAGYLFHRATILQELDDEAARASTLAEARELLGSP